MTSISAGGWRATAQKLIALIPGPVMAAVIAPCTVLFLGQALNDGDTYWHIAAGGWMSDHLQVLHTDIFSHTYSGRPWASHEWLSSRGVRLHGVSMQTRRLLGEFAQEPRRQEILSALAG